MSKTMLVVCVFALFLCAGQAYSQEAPAAQTPATTPSQDTAAKSTTVFRYTTHLVLVDVVATDHTGKPVTDLKKEDFTLEEDGQNQQIDSFSFQGPEEKSGQSGRSSTFANVSASTLTNVPRYDATKTLTVLLLDSMNTTARNQTVARQEMLKFVEKLPAGQPIAVYAMSSKLRLIQDFTTDPSILKKAIKALESHNSPVLQNPTGGGGNPNSYDPGTMEQLSELQGTAAQAIFTQVQQYALDTAVVQTDLRVSMTLAALTSMARGLAAYPGRKNLIWLTEGYPLTRLADTLGDLSATNPRTMLNDRDYSTQAAWAASILTDAQVALYPVDVGAVQNDTVYASLSNTDANGNYLGRTATGRGTTGRNPNQAMSNELNITGITAFDVHAAMNDLADRTGGKAFYGHNNIDEGIREGLADGSTYYALAYHPQNKKWNGKFRKISVKVSQPGIKLRYRLGYYAVDTTSYNKLDEKLRAQDFEQALDPDFPSSTALIFMAHVFPPSEKTNNKLIVNFGIDPHGILFEPDANGQRGDVDYAVAVYTKKGKRVKLEVQTLKAAMKQDVFDKIMNSYLPCQLQTTLPPGEYVLRLGVRDNRTGLIGTLNSSVTVPPTK